MKLYLNYYKKNATIQLIGICFSFSTCFSFLYFLKNISSFLVVVVFFFSSVFNKLKITAISTLDQRTFVLYYFNFQSACFSLSHPLKKQKLNRWQWRHRRWWWGWIYRNFLSLIIYFTMSEWYVQLLVHSKSSMLWIVLVFYFFGMHLYMALLDLRLEMRD